MSDYVGLALEWTGLSYEERASGKQSLLLYALSLLIVFLCLVALYESWVISVSVMLVVPLGVSGTLLAAMIRVMPNDIYFQVGLLTIVGLSAKNAILIVEFAKALMEQGKPAVEAILEAAHMRFRPILMTSLAFGWSIAPGNQHWSRFRQPKCNRYRCVRGYANGNSSGYLLCALILSVDS